MRNAFFSEFTTELGARIIKAWQACPTENIATGLIKQYKNHSRKDLFKL